MTAETSIQKFTYGGAEIEFDLVGKNVMINATEMAKAYDTDIEAFRRNKQTELFIKECLKTENSRFFGVEKEEDLIFSRQKSGTWMHRVLALKFAAWLDPAFELWVFKTIDELLFGRYNAYIAEIERTKAMEEELRQLEENMAEDPAFSRLLYLRKQIAGSGKRRAMALKGQYSISFE